MLTRSQSKHAVQLFALNFDFDEASSAWRENKIKQPNGCYKYRCMGQNRDTSCCKRPCMKETDYCKTHYKDDDESSFKM